MSDQEKSMIINPSDYEQIAANGKQEIARIEGLLADNAQRIDGYEAELAKIRIGRENRQKRRQIAQTDVASKQALLDQAAASAKLAHDTPSESKAIKNVSLLKKDLSQAQERLAQAEQPDDQSSENELLDAINQAQDEQKRMADELRNVRHAHDQTLRHQAEKNHASLIQADIEHERRIDELKTQLVEAKAARLNLHSDAIQQLEGHPDLLQSLAARHPIDNAAIRMYEATLHYLDAFMENAHEVEMHAKLASLRHAANMSYTDLWQYLIIHPGQFTNFLQRKPEWNPPPTLPATRARLQMLLE